MSKLISKLNENEGVTLVEMLIAVGAIFIASMGAYALYINVHGSQAEGIAATQAQQEARVIIERIAREVRESSSEVIWLGNNGTSNHIAFFTPRDYDRQFMVDDQGEPAWQSAIAYVLNRSTNELYRHKLYLTNNPNIEYDSYDSMLVARNVEDMSFSQSGNLLSISIKTFTKSNSNINQTARTYADFETTIRMRN